jgi:hypothetical protein
VIKRTKKRKVACDKEIGMPKRRERERERKNKKKMVMGIGDGTIHKTFPKSEMEKDG